MAGPTCECGFVAKNAQGLAAHRRYKHPDDDPSPPKPPATGTRREVLEEVRDRLRAALDEAKPSELLPLTKQLLEVMDELEPRAPVAPLPRQQQEGGAVDDIASRRARRRAEATA